MDCCTGAEPLRETEALAGALDAAVTAGAVVGSATPDGQCLVLTLVFVAFDRKVLKNGWMKTYQ